MCNQEFSFVDNLLKETNLGFADRNWWRELERQVKSKDLNSIAFKISIFNRILAMVIQNIKAGVRNWSLMDSKYFGEYSKVIEACLAQIDKLNDFLADADDMFKIEYFGVPPLNYDKDLNVYAKVNQYYRDYLRNVTRKLNPDLDEYLIRELVDETVVLITKRYGMSSTHHPGINSKLVLYTLIKLVEKSIKLRKIKWIYLLDPVKNSINDLLKRVDIKSVLNEANTKGQFNIKDKLFESDQAYKNLIGYQMQTKRAVKKRNIKMEVKRKESIDFIIDEPNERTVTSIVKRSLFKSISVDGSYGSQMHKRSKQNDVKVEEPHKTLKFTCKDINYDLYNVDDIDSVSSTNSDGFTNDLDNVLQDTRYV
jgi:hypothetical protein